MTGLTPQKWICLGLLAVCGWLSLARAADSVPTRLRVPGIENLFRVTDRIFSGGQPQGDTGFAALRELGVKTVLSVDGAKPDAERAAKFGLRYVHIPHGYDGVSANTVARLVKAALVLEGPLFVHCHHGQHRGPAAVGVICQATAGWTTNQAIAWLKQAGTAADYAGLFRANSEFRPPTAEEIARVPTHFAPHASVSGLVEAMVELDRRWENLKAIQDAGWRVPANQPDLVPASEALLLQEAYAELLRGNEAKAKGDKFLEHLKDGETRAKDFHVLLKARFATLDGATRKRADEVFRAAGQSCAACHHQFRN